MVEAPGLRPPGQTHSLGANPSTAPAQLELGHCPSAPTAEYGASHARTSGLPAGPCLPHLQGEPRTPPGDRGCQRSRTSGRFPRAALDPPLSSGTAASPGAALHSLPGSPSRPQPQPGPGRKTGLHRGNRRRSGPQGRCRYPPGDTCTQTRAGFPARLKAGPGTARQGLRAQREVTAVGRGEGQAGPVPPPQGVGLPAPRTVRLCAALVPAPHGGRCALAPRESSRGPSLGASAAAPGGGGVTARWWHLLFREGGPERPGAIGLQGLQAPPAPRPGAPCPAAPSAPRESA